MRNFLILFFTICIVNSVQAGPLENETSTAYWNRVERSCDDLLILQTNEELAGFRKKHLMWNDALWLNTFELGMAQSRCRLHQSMAQSLRISRADVALETSVGLTKDRWEFILDQCRYLFSIKTEGEFNASAKIQDINTDSLWRLESYGDVFTAKQTCRMVANYVAKQQPELLE